jgi:predicted negative regulator of RcsB-dependent stress response
MASHLDLEEQEQLDQLKHFWKTYGNLISWVLILAFGGIAAWNGWQWWNRDQAMKASVVHEEVERAAAAGDLARAERAFADARERFGRTVFAQQSALLVAQAAVDQGKPDTAKAALAWVVEQGKDPGYQAVARLRLAAVHADAKAWDEALKVLSAEFPASFEALAADRRGDIHSLQGRKDQAKAEYTKAWQALDPQAEYRRLVEVKLTALGVDTQALGGKAGEAGAKS